MTKDWSAHKTNNPQGTDYKEIFINGKISELKFNIKPKSKFWRAGFKLYDPNSDIFPLRSNNSLLFHLGSTLSDKEFGMTAYLDGNHIKELNKTRKYPENKLLTIKLEINHNNFFRVYVNGSLEFKPLWHLKNPNIREKITVIAWGDENNYEVEFKKINALNWKEKERSLVNKKSLKTMLFSFFNNLTNPQKFIGAILVGVIVLIIGNLLLTPQSHQLNNIPFEVPTETLGITTSPVPTTEITKNVEKQITIEEGKSYTDFVSGMTVGVNWVLYKSYATLTITFPNKASEEFSEVKSGKEFYFKGKDELNYTLTIEEIGFNDIIIRINFQ